MERSFLDKLRKGVSTIETEVKKLKELTEEGDLVTEEQLRDNLIKAKTFDAEVRQTYSEVSQLLNAIKSCGHPLNESKNTIVSIKQRLYDIEDNSNLKKYGYKPFPEKYSMDTINDNLTEEEEEVAEKPIDNYSSGENILNAKHLVEEFPQKLDLREDPTTQTVLFAPDMPIVNKRGGSNDRTKPETKNTENRDQNISKKYDKLFNRTPQPHDFGITRRFNIFPQIYNNRVDPTKTPEQPIDTTQTCRFNYINNNGFQMGSALNPMTPPNPSNNTNGGDSFVTVEFTPGLTTHRPKGISRVQDNNPNNGNNNKMNKTFNYKSNKEKETKNCFGNTYTQRLPQSILQSVENDKITPEQPIPVTDTTKSVHILRSIGGKSSGTPPLPKSRIDVNFHNQILKHL